MVGLHTVVRYYLPDGKELLQGGATVIAKLSNWIELEDDYEKIKSLSMVLDFVSYANAFVSGLFYKEAEGTPLNSAFIPKIPADDWESKGQVFDSCCNIIRMCHVLKNRIET